LRNGTVDHEQTDYPKGDPENKVGLIALHTKFRRLSSLLLPPSKIEAWLESISNVEKFDDIADMWHI